MTSNNENGNIPDIVIGRLPVYLRALNRLSSEGYEITSSHELGHRLGISSAQIRKDLSHFGGFGKQGTGYQIEFLQDKLRKVLRVDREWEVALVGTGDLGKAIAHYKGFGNRGFHISCAFDSASEKVGQTIADIRVQPMSELEKTITGRKIQLAMIAVPAEHAQAVADTLIEYGIRGILNYAPINLTVPNTVYVQYIDPVVGLQRMTYYLD